MLDFRVLIVEDSEMLQKVILRQCQAKNIPAEALFVAKSYTSAQQAIAEKSFQLIFLDDEIFEHDSDEDDPSNHPPRRLGYSLIPLIKRDQPETTVIGISSSQEENPNNQPVLTVEKSEVSEFIHNFMTERV